MLKKNKQKLKDFAGPSKIENHRISNKHTAKY